MKLEILMSCMNQQDDTLVRCSHITGHAVVINQCGQVDYRAYPTETGVARMWSTDQRGLTKSRNMAIAALPQADVVIFRMVNYPCGLGDRVRRLKFPQTMHVASWQIAFRRERLLKSGVCFDELLGAGTGNGAEEELKFMLDCQRAGLKIYYAPVEIASVAQTESTWFTGFDETFFYNRGATTRYILGVPMAAAYGLYYVAKKREMYLPYISTGGALRALLRGIVENRIGKLARQGR